MVETRMMINCDHTAAICAAIYNSRMGIKSGQMTTPDKLNPYREKKRKKGGKVKLEDFAKAWGK
tara:strand:+ start:670 stop:861 length:192 start_codon:yes stop_codon:yes gene_type:complete